MTYHTIEHKVSSNRSWKNPLYTGNRTYHNITALNKRLRWLRNEYGEENIACMPYKGDKATKVIYIRVA